MVLAPMGSFLRALSCLASYDRGPPGPYAQVRPPPIVRPPASVLHPIVVSNFRRDGRGGGSVCSAGLVLGCGTAVVMSRLYKIEDRVAWIPVLTFISLVGGCMHPDVC